MVPAFFPFSFYSMHFDFTFFFARLFSTRPCHEELDGAKSEVSLWHDVDLYVSALRILEAVPQMATDGHRPHFSDRTRHDSSRLVTAPAPR